MKGIEQFPTKSPSKKGVVMDRHVWHAQLGFSLRV